MRLSLPADLYLDAILGTGFKPPVSGLYADAIAIMNASQVPVIAVDIPSGADADADEPAAGNDCARGLRSLRLRRRVRRMFSVC